MERAACTATGLGELGVGTGDAIGIVLRNDFPFFEASYAAQRLGAYSVPVNWHGKTQEIAYVLNDRGAKAVVAHADLLPEVVDDKCREIGLDGLVTLGDVGYLDEDGYLFICDRARDIVISGGVNIYPAEIEMALLAMPGVRDCAVFGIPDEEFGEKLCAHIEPDPAVLFGAAEVAHSCASVWPISKCRG